LSANCDFCTCLQIGEPNRLGSDLLPNELPFVLVLVFFFFLQKATDSGSDSKDNHNYTHSQHNTATKAVATNEPNVIPLAAATTTW
jgi:hypothetical protein